ncbi:MAG TPA: hypothetical protein VK149_04145 [Sideroxyarcus sp.]|nr:hypothetical protein [Sideroxyarcus sp.]
MTDFVAWMLMGVVCVLSVAVGYRAGYWRGETDASDFWVKYIAGDDRD